MELLEAAALTLFLGVELRPAAGSEPERESFFMGGGGSSEKA